MFFRNRTICYIIILTFFLNSVFFTCLAQGSLILKEKVKKLQTEKCDKKFVKNRFGSPTFIVKTNAIKIFCYYYLSYSKKKNRGIKRRCLFIYFKNNMYIGYKFY